MTINCKNVDNEPNHKRRILPHNLEYAMSTDLGLAEELFPLFLLAATEREEVAEEGREGQVPAGGEGGEGWERGGEVEGGIGNGKRWQDGG